MENIFIQIFTSFWPWLGFMCILSLIAGTILGLYNRKLRHERIMHLGWPPEHCDADGDFKDADNDDDDDDDDNW